jgi:hypothetical protein
MDDDWLLSRLFDWWLERPAWIRVGVGLAFMAFGIWGLIGVIWPSPNTAAALGDNRGIVGSIVWIGLGFTLCILGGKSPSERNGYHF